VIHKYLLPLVSVAAFGFALFYVLQGRTADTPAPLFQSPVSRPLRADLAGSGIVEPLTQNIAVGSPLPGIVVEVIGDERLGTLVKKGELLFKLDDRQQRAELAVRKTALASAEAQLAKLEAMPRPEEVTPVKAKVEEAEASLSEAKYLLDALTKLKGTGASSLQDWGRAKRDLEALKAQKAKAEADLKLIEAGAWEPEKVISRAAVAQAKAQVEQAETELKRLEVRALADGELLQIKVRPGEFVGAPPGQTLILLGNLQELHVRVDIDEHDAPRYRPGAAATGILRGQADYAYALEYVQTEPYIVPKKSLTGDNAERVDTRVLQVIYKLKAKPDPAHRVYVGQQMDVFIEQPPETAAGS
jgi:multidrug resistance efflux pump